MALEKITNPPLTDSTGATMVQKLEAIKNVLQPTNAGTDIDILIPSSGWSEESPYTYTYSNAHITSGALVKVTFLEGSGNDGAPKFIYFEKVTGGVRFEATVLPTTDISVRLHIFSADTTSTAATSADEVSTNAVSGAANVEDALGALNSNLTNTNTELGKWKSAGSNESDLNNCKTFGLFCASPTTSNIPTSGYYVVMNFLRSSTDLAQIAVDVNNAKTYVRAFHDGTTWTAWKTIAS